MTSAVFTANSFDADAQSNSRPAPVKRRAPVFIQDAVTPWNGETMLLALLRAQALEDEDQP